MAHDGVEACCSEMLLLRIFFNNIEVLCDKRFSSASPASELIPRCVGMAWPCPGECGGGRSDPPSPQSRRANPKARARTRPASPPLATRPLSTSLNPLKFLAEALEMVYGSTEKALRKFTDDPGPGSPLRKWQEFVSFLAGFCSVLSGKSHADAHKSLKRA